MNLELIKAIVILPGTALVYIPGAMLWLVAESGAAISLAGLARPRFWFALVLGASGLALAVWTVRLFRTVGEGTPAPWAPPKRLVVRGPYRHNYRRSPWRGIAYRCAVLVMLCSNPADHMRHRVMHSLGGCFHWIRRRPGPAQRSARSDDEADCPSASRMHRLPELPRATVMRSRR